MTWKTENQIINFPGKEERRERLLSLNSICTALCIAGLEPEDTSVCPDHRARTEGGCDGAMDDPI